MLAILCARGGSKGLPGKNIKPLGGKPLIAHTVAAALEARLISRLVVSTDDEAIAAAARAAGAEVPFMRPAELAGDESLVIDTWFYTMDRLAQQEGAQYPAFMALQATSPLRTAQDLDQAIALFEEKQADAVIGVRPAPAPPSWLLRLDDAGVARKLLEPDSGPKNRQEYGQAYIPNGAIYIFRSEPLRRTRQYYTERTYAYVMPPERSVDIDDALDFAWAEFLYQRRTA